MTLKEWADEYGRGAVTELLRRSGVSATTIQQVIQGRPLSRRTVAEKLSDATEGAVTVETLLGLDSGTGSGDDG